MMNSEMPCRLFFNQANKKINRYRVDTDYAKRVIAHAHFRLRKNKSKVMFNTITWESFLYAGALFIGGYYVITTLLLYHQEIINWFKPKPLARTTTAPSPDESYADQESVMGSVSAEEAWLSKRTAVVESEAIIIAEAADDEMPETITKAGETDLLNSSVSELMQEVKALLNMAAEYKSSKAEVAPLFNALFERYPHLKNTTYAHAINKHICEEGKSKFVFEFHTLEVRAWWETAHN